MGPSPEKPHGPSYSSHALCHWSFHNQRNNTEVCDLSINHDLQGTGTTGPHKCLCA